MPYNIIPRRIHTLGYCCPYAYFKASRFHTHEQLRQELLCSKVSVRKWRKKSLQCLNSSGCLCRAKVLAASLDTGSAPASESPAPIAAQTDAIPFPRAADCDQESPC